MSKLLVVAWLMGCVDVDVKPAESDAERPSCGIAVDRCGETPLVVDYQTDAEWRADLNTWFVCVRFAAGEIRIP
jgi:hypothetical protein